MVGILIALLACSGDESVPSAIVSTADTGESENTEEPVVTTPDAREATWTDGTWTTTLSITVPDDGARTYRLSTDHPLRDGAAMQRTVTEVSGEAVLRTGSVLHDALFALAMQEQRAASVSEITDGAFADGSATPCECFETGDKWSYVWTRDTAYAAHLALGWFAPERTAESLRFKLSAPKPGTGRTGLQIVQDTGSGGSWPVSTDRVTWALGATATLPHLTGPDRDRFAAEAAEAMMNTAWQDHDVLLASDGLMRGEQSFLDWREQTYPLSTADDVTMLAESKAFGTNLAHLHLLRSAAAMADGGDATTLSRWADELEAAVQDEFWQDGEPFVGWSSWIGPALDPGPRAQRDLLATALGVLLLDDGGQGAEALAAYPRGPVGPPVIWPNHPDVPIYHNRGQWPFVTAYELWAARRVRHADVFQADVDALVRGAVLNLSNMENLEWFTGEPWLDAGDASGPVVNSERQLWSVAGYLSMWLRGVLGLELSDDGRYLVVDPFLTSGMRDALGSEIVLRDLPFAGGTIDIVVELPDDSAPSWVLDTVAVDDVAYASGAVPVGDVRDGAEVRITLAPHDASSPPATWMTVDALAPSAPAAPTLRWGNNGVELDIPSVAGATVDVYRDGELVAQAVPQGVWVDPAGDGQDITHCWSVTATAVGATVGDRVSHRSPAVCFWGTEGERVQVLSAHGFVAGDGVWSTEHGRAHVGSWGDPEHTLEQRFQAHSDGRHLIQVVYSNGAGPFSTGITAAHKWLRISPADGGAPVAEGPVVLPQTAGWDAWRESTIVAATLEQDVAYRLEIMDAPGLPNMSWLEHFASYTGGLGGGPTPFGAANIAEVKLLAMTGPTRVPAGDAVPLDGSDDIDKHDFVQSPGASLQPWEAFGLDWDDDFLYVTWVGEAFEDPFVPAMLYLEVSPSGAGNPGTGMPYGGLVPQLPFVPTHAVALRAQSDAGDGVGPWSGIWEAQGSNWVQLRRFEEGVDAFVAADRHTLSARVPRYLLAGASLRVAGHVVRGVPGGEWVDTVPAGHTPWADGGADLWIDLDGSHDPADW